MSTLPFSVAPKLNINLQRKLQVYLGLLLISLYCIQANVDWRWDFLNSLQQDFLFKQITGFIFLGAIFLQWRLYYYRSSKINKPIREIYFSHHSLGALLPLPLYLHAAEVGYGLQTILAICFLITIFTGLLTPHTWGIRQKYYVNSWLITHVLSASLMMGLVFYHVYIIYWYG